MNPRALIDDAEAAVALLKSSITANVTSGLGSISSRQRELHIVMNLTSQNGNYQLRDELQERLAVLNEIKNQAADAQVNITSCLEENEDNLNQLPDVLLVDLDSCLSTTSEATEVILEDSIDVVNGTLRLVSVVEGQLERCGTAIICLYAVIYEADTQRTSIAHLIEDEVESADIFVGSSEVIMQTCAVQASVRMRVQSGRILQEIEQCVNDILGNP